MPTIGNPHLIVMDAITHPVKIDLDKKLDPKQKTIQAFISSFSEL